FLNRLRLRSLRGSLGLGDGPVWRANFETGEAPDRDVLAELRHLRGDDLRDGMGLLLDEGLVEEAELLVELTELALEHLLDDVRRLAGCSGLSAVDLLLALEVGLGDLIAADEARIGR